jgi:hypothetical protein
MRGSGGSFSTLSPFHSGFISSACISRLSAFQHNIKDIEVSCSAIINEHKGESGTLISYRIIKRETRKSTTEFSSASACKRSYDH